MFRGNFLKTFSFTLIMMNVQQRGVITIKNSKDHCINYKDNITVKVLSWGMTTLLALADFYYYLIAICRDNSKIRLASFTNWEAA